MSAHMNKIINDVTLPAEMLLNLHAPTEVAGRIDEDDDWRKCKIYLRALFQKHGAFQIDVAKKGIWVPSSHV